MNCYCGKPKTFSECCKVYISGKAVAANAEDVMRSRYSAFCVVDMDYLQQTTDLQVRFDFDEKANEEWARSSQFTKLEIIKTEEAGTKSIVEFKAYFKMDEKESTHHEISTFRKSNGAWFYRSGRIIAGQNI